MKSLQVDKATYGTHSFIWLVYIWELTDKYSKFGVVYMKNLSVTPNHFNLEGVTLIWPQPQVVVVMVISWPMAGLWEGREGGGPLGPSLFGKKITEGRKGG